MATTSTKSDSTTPAVTPPQRSLGKRLFVRFVILLLLVAVGGFSFLYYRSNRLIKSEPYQAAMKYVTNSKLLKEKVGEPVVAVGLLESLRDGSNVSENDAQLQFKMLSPKGPIEVLGSGRKRDDVWSIQSLSVTLPHEQEKLNLMSEVLLDTAGDTPKFDPNAQSQKADVKIDLPTPGNDIKIDIGELPTVPE
jgi:hypothetical protein